MDGCVVVGVSGSLRNMTAVHTAAACACDTGRTLVAVTAWLPPGGEPVVHRGYWPSPNYLARLDQLARENAQRLLTDALACLPNEVTVDARVVQGQPGSVLVAAADRPDDLLVVGTGGRGGLLRLNHGAVARYCLGHAVCPVLAVPEPALLRDLGRFHRHRRVTVPDGLSAASSD